jgi:hypothetical protein
MQRHIPEGSKFYSHRRGIRKSINEYYQIPVLNSSLNILHRLRSVSMSE